MFWAMSSRETSSWWFNERIHFSPITMSLEVGSPDLKKQLQDVIKPRFFLYLHSTILSIVASHIVVDGTMAVTSSSSLLCLWQEEGGRDGSSFIYPLSY